MTIADVTKPDLPRNNVRAASRDHKAERPARVTVRLDNNVPGADLPRTPEPVEITPEPRIEYDYPPLTHSRSNLLKTLFLRHATTLRVVLALVVLLGGVATITISAVS
jgi:hypothetical protein